MLYTRRISKALMPVHRVFSVSLDYLFYFLRSLNVNLPLITVIT